MLFSAFDLLGSHNSAGRNRKRGDEEAWPAIGRAAYSVTPDSQFQTEGRKEGRKGGKKSGGNGPEGST